MKRIDPHPVADELTTLSGFFDYQRATLLDTCDGVTASPAQPNGFAENGFARLAVGGA
jgi:hypothetical protein